MKKIIFLILLSACSIKLPPELPDQINNPINISKNGKTITVYIEGQGRNYSIVGIHPLSGREFLVQVKTGQVVKEEYGYIFSKSEVREILNQILK